MIYITEKVEPRKNKMTFNQSAFAKLVLKDLAVSQSTRSVVMNYKQSEVREMVENFAAEANQKKLLEISNALYARSSHYKRLIQYFSGMSTMSMVIAPSKDIRQDNKDKVLKQYSTIGELLKLMNPKHEFGKLLESVLRDDTFYGYAHKDKRSFYIQRFEPEHCQITSVEDGVFNFSINMQSLKTNKNLIKTYPEEVNQKFLKWQQDKKKNSKLSDWVELDAKNTICIKANEGFLENLPPFVGIFDSIFDIDAFKQLRKDKEELSNYMLVTQELPIRENSDDNNDFAIDEPMFRAFHNQLADTLPENVGVATTPMKVNTVRFDKDKADSDGVAKAERDLWSATGTSALLFSADKSTSQGLLMSIKTDEEIVFKIMDQIERWINRYLKLNLTKNLYFSVNILPVTLFNKKEMFDTYLQAGQYGFPVKSHLSATVGISPIEMMNMAHLENDLLKLHEEFIPLQSSHTQSGQDKQEAGSPEKDPEELTDEGARDIDKAN